MINFKEFLSEAKERWLGTSDYKKNYHEDSKVRDTHDNNMKRLHTFKPLTEKERNSIWDYTGNHFMRINRYHRTGSAVKPGNTKDFTDQQNKYAKETTRYLDKSIKKHTTEHNIHLWRGFSKAFNDMKIKKGDIVSDKGFLSTSTKPHIAKKGFASDHFAHIKVPKGSKALNLGSMSSGLTCEGEVLLPRNAKLRYEGKTTHKDNPDYPEYSKITTIHHFTHIPEEN